MTEKLREELRKRLHTILDQMLDEDASQGIVSFRPDLDGFQVNARLNLEVQKG